MTIHVTLKLRFAFIPIIQFRKNLQQPRKILHFRRPINNRKPIFCCPPTTRTTGRSFAP